MNTDVPLSPILVADDNHTDLFFLQHRLTAAGVRHPLQPAEDGADAIRMIERCLAEGTPAQRPWLIFVDLKMPRLDGFAVLKWIQERGLLDQITVVVLSTSDEPKDVERARLLGAHRYLVKYPRPAALAEVVGFAEERARHLRFGCAGSIGIGSHELRIEDAV